VLHKLAHAHQLARRAELLLGGFKGRDGGGGAVGAVQIPGEEAREVLQCAEELVAADWGVVSMVLWLWLWLGMGKGGFMGYGVG
jgi:hypothetical protein